MNTIQQGIVTLLRSAVTGEALPLPPDFSMEAAMETVTRHGIYTLAYTGAIHCGVERSDPAMKALFPLYCKALLQSEGQLRELDRLFAAFEEAGVDYLPLKGCNLKKLYPKPELRPMGDGDILIREEQYEEKIVPLVESLGYTFRADYDPEAVWQKDALYLELHRRLFGAENRSLCRFFGYGWPENLLSNSPSQKSKIFASPLLKAGAEGAAAPGEGLGEAISELRAKPALPPALARGVAEQSEAGGRKSRYTELPEDAAAPEGSSHRFSMTPEGEFLYLFCHFVRHFRDGGIGCRHVLDLWVYRRSYPDLAEGRIREALAGLGLLEFYENIRRLMAAWFEDGPMEEKTEALTEFLFDSGSFGKAENRTVAQGKSRLRYLLGAAFPGCRVLRDKYPLLKKAPWLLPLVWLYRPVYKLLFERSFWKVHGTNLRRLNREALQDRKTLLRQVGLGEER